MSITVWIVLYVLNSFWWKWIISWGGAQWVEGWKSFLLIEWFALDWNAEQIRLYALCTWVLSTLWFIAGMLVPGLRGSGLLL